MLIQPLILWVFILFMWIGSTEEWNEKKEEDWIAGATQMTHFKYIGRTTKTTGFAHLIFNINLLPMEEDMRRICKLLTQVHREGDTFDMVMQYRLLRERCKDHADDYIQMRTLWSTNLHEVTDRYPDQSIPWDPVRVLRHQGLAGQDREKRQIVLGIISMIVSFASAIYTMTQLASISTDADDATIVEHLHDDEIQIAAHDRSLKALNKTIHEFAEDLMAVKNVTESLILFSRLSQVCSMSFDNWDRVMSGLEFLTLNKISPRLVDTVVMNQAVNRVAEKIKRTGYELDVEETDDFYKFPVSYVAFRNSTIRVFIHVPLRQMGVPMDIFQYLKTPLQLTNGTYLFPLIEETILIADSSRTTFMSMTDNEYVACAAKTVSGCPRGQIYFTSEKHNCLMNLYTGDMEKVTNNCRFEVNPSGSHVSPLGGNDYLIYFPTDNDLELRCLGRQGNQRFSGGRQIRIPPGCTVAGPDFILYGRVDVVSETTTVFRKVVDLDQILKISGLSNIELEKALKELQVIGSTEGISIPKIKLEYAQGLASRVTNWIIVICIGVLSAGVLLLFCVKGRKIIFRRWDKIIEWDPRYWYIPRCRPCRSPDSSAHNSEEYNRPPAEAPDHEQNPTLPFPSSNSDLSGVHAANAYFNHPLNQPLRDRVELSRIYPSPGSPSGPSVLEGY